MPFLGFLEHSGNNPTSEFAMDRVAFRVAHTLRMPHIARCIGISNCRAISTSKGGVCEEDAINGALAILSRAMACGVQIPSIGSLSSLDMYAGEQRERLCSCDGVHVTPMQGKAGRLDTLIQGWQ